MHTRFLMNEVHPEGYKAMFGLERTAREASIPAKLKELIKIRASQLNGCAFCLDMHTKEARKIGETEQRLYTLSAWREAPYFTPEERAVLALTEAVTKLAAHGVPDADYEAVRAFFDEKQTAEIIMQIVVINAWNRIAVSTRLMPPVE